MFDSGNKPMDHVHSAYLDALRTLNDSLPVDSLFRQAPDPLKLAQLKELTEFLPQKGSVLDVGSGQGLVPHALHLLGYSVFSVDAPRLSGPGPLERLLHLGIPGAYGEVGVDQLPLDRESIDAVFAGDVIEHLPDSPRPFLEHLSEVLRPGGLIMLSTPNATRLTVRTKVLLGFSNWPSIEDYFDEGVHGGHHKEYTANEILLVLRRVGFVDIEVEYVENRIMTAPWTHIRDMKSQKRSGVDFQRPSGLKRVRMQVVRRGAMTVIKLVPSLASVLIATGRKPKAGHVSEVAPFESGGN